MPPDIEADSRPSLVVTGSSAGGIDALIALVGGLPSGFAAPVVIAQHLAPGHASRLATILQGKTPLAVRTVEDEEPLTAGTIFLVGADHDVEIFDDRVKVVSVARRGPKPSIDHLFATAAQAYGERLFAIIFSGMGSDGLSGARLVKEHGGTVIIQEPLTATYPAMPLAIPPTLVDLSAAPDAMGALLVDLLRRAVVPQTPVEQGDLRALLGHVRERSGVDFSHYKMPTIMRRISRLMIASGAGSLGEYLRLLERHPEGYRRLVSAFLIKVTEFFRDSSLFDELRTAILPGLIARAREHGNELRIWSAGTSTGEEAYSLAILCAELLREEGGVPVRIFATDLDDDAIAFARRGLYAARSLADLPPGILDRYFVRVGDGYEVGKLIRNMTVFGQHDLGQRAPFPRIDLCVCRNVLIYFTKELQTRALQLFAFALRDEGYLVLGKAESAGAFADYFRQVDSRLKIYQRQGDRIVVPPTRLTDVPSGLRTAPDKAVPAPAAQGSRAPGLSTTEAFGAFVAASMIGIVVVDRRYDIRAINAAARTLLEIHGVALGDDLIHLVRNIEGDTLRALIDAAFAGDSTASHDVPMADPAGGVERWLQISAAAAEAEPDSRNDAIAVLIVDVTEKVGRRRELEQLVGDQRSQLEDYSRRIEEFSRRQKSLLHANDELTAANVELRDLNEQLLINAEETASANEEIETLNEEMQATNEELETLNEELQATVEELNTTNDELESRGGELERLAEKREAAVQRIDAELRAAYAALEAGAGPIAVVGDDGSLVYASEAVGGIAGVAKWPREWWRDGPVAVDGMRYETSVLEKGRFTVVALRTRG